MAEGVVGAMSRTVLADAAGATALLVDGEGGIYGLEGLLEEVAPAVFIGNVVGAAVAVGDGVAVEHNNSIPLRPILPHLRKRVKRALIHVLLGEVEYVHVDVVDRRWGGRGEEEGEEEGDQHMIRNLHF